MSVVDQPGFKQTEIGRMPTDWSAEKVATLADIDSESLSNKTPTDFSFRYVSLGDVSGGQLIGSQDQITLAEAPSRARRIVKSGDVLFATVRPNLKGHFFARHVVGDIVASTGFAVIRAKQGVADPAFVYQSLLSGYVDAQIEKLTAGSNYPAVNSADVKGILLPTPPLREQQKIAEILTTVDDKLDVIARQIEATQTLKQGLMQTLFSFGTSAQAAEDWPTVELHTVAQVRTGVAKGKKGLKDPVELPYLRVANVQAGHIDLSEVKTIEVEASQVERYALHVGDVLMTEGGDFDKLGRGDVWLGQIAPCLHQNHVFAVRPDPSKLNPHYLAEFASSEQGRRYFLGCAKRTTNLASINSSQLKAFPIPLPHLKQQAVITAVAASVNAKIKLLEAKRREQEKLKRGLMQKLLTGEWRVKVDTEMAA